jgi:NAD(P)-dependent dehydrogenase (short-subunit alcohol dehydrogenase family)
MPERKGKVLILGASSTIGLSTCSRYLENGYEVLAQYRVSAERFTTLESDFLTPVYCDLADLDSAG